MKSFIFPTSHGGKAIKVAVIRLSMILATISVLALFLLVAGYVLYRGLPHISLELITSEPSLIRDIIGIFPNILTTLYMVVITLCISLPVGVGAAIYLNEYANNQRLIHVIQFTIDILAGIPSIIYGLIGLLIFVQWFSLGTSILAGSCTLAMMVLPLIVRTAQEALKTVPTSYREGGLALGSGKWHMIRTLVLPSASHGILTGILLSIGRILGESAALLFTAGMASKVITPLHSLLPNTSGATLTVALYTYAKERGEFEVAFAIAVILLVLTILIQLVAKCVSYSLKKRW